jgi:hypothetical protein
VEIFDLGELHWLLGIEIKCDRGRRLLHLSQHSYIDAILKHYGFEDVKPVNIRLTSAQAPATTAEHAQMAHAPYHEVVGSLMYVMLTTRPDIAYVVQTVSRFATNPGPTHWEAVKKVFKYLKGTHNLWLTYG